LIPDLISAADNRIRQQIEDYLATYRRELLHILDHFGSAVRETENQIVQIINAVPDKDIPLFNIVSCHRDIARRIQDSFEKRVRENAQAVLDFHERISKCQLIIREMSEEQVYLRHHTR
jgi:hypothetical protein